MFGFCPLPGDLERGVVGHGDMWEDSVKIEEDKCSAPTKVSTCYSSSDETRREREIQDREREREDKERG